MPPNPFPDIYFLRVGNFFNFQIIDAVQKALDKMMQEFNVVCCYSCSTYQVEQVNYMYFTIFVSNLSILHIVYIFIISSSTIGP